MKNINLNSLKIFFEVAASKSYLEAANKLFISQPAISRSMIKLEEEMGTQLLYRNNKGIALSPSGQVLFEFLKSMKDSFDVCKREIMAIDDIEKGSLVIGIQSHIVRNYLMDKIAHFRIKHPNIKIELIDMPTYQLIERIGNRKLDFAIDSSPIETSYSNITVIPIKSISTCFIVSVNKDTSNIKSIKDLEQENIILPIMRSSLRRNLNRVLVDNNCKIRTILEFGTEDLIIDSVRRNFGIGYVVEPGINHLIKSSVVKKVDVDCELPKLEVNLIKIDNDLTEIAKLFINEEILQDILINERMITKNE